MGHHDSTPFNGQAHMLVQLSCPAFNDAAACCKQAVT